VDLLSRLTRHLPLTLAVLALIVLAIVIALVLLVRRRRVPPAGEQPAPAGTGAVVVDFRQAGSHQRLASAFRRALAELRRHLGAGDSRYRLPWYLLLGEEASGKSRLFADSGLNLPLGAPAEPSPDSGEGVAFWFFDHGVVLDVAGEYVLGAGGGTPNERGWRHFLSLLRENRPERPLDGVVLAIPCAELAGPPEQEGARLAAAAEKGAALFRKLRQAQESLGMSFPVYILVTGCERVPGFESYVTEIPDHLRGDLFGWSNPYTPETAYRPEWIDEAFTLLGAGLHRVQIEAFGDQAVLEDPDGVFCFPEEFQRLKGPLRVYLNQIFRASAYHEMLSCRGLYLCGGLPREDRAGELLRDPGAVGGAVFVRDVFDRKVFPERDLARPTNLALIQGGRRLRVLQAAVVTLALISTLGLGWARYRLSQREDDLRAFLLSTAQNLEETRDRRLKGAAEHEFLRDKAFHLFEGMSKLDGDWFGSVFIPSSWFSPFNHGLERAIVRAYNEIILTTLYQELGRSLDRIIVTARPVSLAAEAAALPEGGGGVLPSDRFIAWDPGAAAGASASPFDLRPLERTPEFMRLSGYAGSLRDLETHVVLYNRLRNTESLEDLNAVVHYLFEHDLPKGFFDNAELYTGALADVAYTRFQPLQHRPRTTGQADELGKLLFDRLFAQNPAVADLRGAATLLGQVSDAAWNPGSGDTVASLITLRTQLKRAEQELASPNLAWMAGDNLELGAPWKQFLQVVRATVFLGPETADSLQEEGARRYQDFRRGLFGLETRSTGPLVARDVKSGALALSPPAKLLADALDGLSQQGFVSAAAAGAPAAAALSPRGRVLWDTATLQQAEGLYKPYEGFIEKTLAPFPPDLRNTLQASARDRLGAKMLAQVADAQQAGPEPDLSSALLLEQALEAEVANFQAAAAPIAGLTDRFGKLGLYAAKDQVAAAFTAQGAQILADADRLLTLRAPYTPKGSGFDWWGGGRHLSLDAYGVRDEAELAAYLGAQRSTVADISSRYAEPVIQALGGKASSRSLRASFARWTAIGEQLRRYAGKEPGNSVTGLEEFILKDLTEIEPANCTRRISTRMLAEPAADFFQERRGGLRRQVWDRCLYLAGGQAAEGYRKLADFFNQRLAGKFPFAASPPGRLDPEADPEDIRAFFQLYAAYAPIVRAVPDADRPPGTGEFIDRMDGVRALFAAFLDDPARPEAPAFDLAIRFRDNRREERGGDQILRWSLASGEQVATHPNTRPVISWTYGTPLRLELQWAKDSPVIPVESADLPGVHVQGRTAILEVRDRWSLLSLVRGLGSPVDADADPGAERLRLQVATRPEADPKAKPEMARVFVALALRAPERRDRTAGKDAAASAATAGVAAAPAGDLELPAFPLSAPAWRVKSDVMSEGR
jgi:type VI secretion system protein ImpL